MLTVQDKAASSVTYIIISFFLVISILDNKSPPKNWHAQYSTRERADLSQMS
jgi:hypothetical protein